jgi:hypothetical protein
LKETEDVLSLQRASFGEIQAGRDVHVHLTQAETPPHELVRKLIGPTAASTFAGKIEAFLEEYLVAEEGAAAIPFAGRANELDRLDRWLDSSKAAPRFILTAPAGRGKSALVVHWIQRLEKRRCIGGAGDSWSLVFVPISMRFNTNQPEVFYEAIAAQLAQALGKYLKPAQIDPIAYYEDHCRLLLDEAIQAKKRILLIVDGLDEALWHSFGTTWFPRSPAPLIRLLVTARLQVGDEDSRGWIARLGWTAGTRVEAAELSPLNLGGVRDLLLAVGAPVGELASRKEFVRKIHDLALGEPLLLRLYVDSLWRNDDQSYRLTVEDLSRIKPGFGGYFSDWLDRQRRAWIVEQRHGIQIDEPTLLAHLAVLACAYGPITSEELSDLVRESGGVTQSFRTELALFPLRRFIIGTGRRSRAKDAGYVLSHPKFGEFLREEYFDRARIRQVQECFAKWGHARLRQVNRRPCEAPMMPEYLLQYLGQHFDDISAPLKEYMQFVEEGWLQAWFSFEGGYRGFSRDVQRAAQAASRLKGRNHRSLEFRCKMILSSIRSVGATVVPTLVVKCVKREILPLKSALYWAEGGYASSRAQIVADLSPMLPEDERADLLTDTCAAITKVYADDESVFDAVSILVPLLAESEQKHMLLWGSSRAENIPDNKVRAEAFASLAKVMPAEQKANAIDKSLVATKSLQEPGSRADIFVKLAILQSGEEQSVFVKAALDTAREIQAPGPRAVRLARIATKFELEINRNELRSEILGACGMLRSSYDDENDRAWALGLVAPILDASLISDALVAARSLKDDSHRAYALASVACKLGDRQRDVIEEAIESVHRSTSPAPIRIEALVSIIKCLPEPQRMALLEEALFVTKNIVYTPYGLESLAGIADLCPDNFLVEVLAVARALNDGNSRAEPLVAVARLLPQSDKPSAFNQAISTAMESYGWQKAFALCHIAKEMPEDQRREVLNEAIMASESVGGSIRSSVQKKIIELASSGDRDELICEALIHARGLNDDHERASALINLAEVLSANERSVVLDEATATAKALTGHLWQADLLISLARQAEGTAKVDILGSAIDAARSSNNRCSEAAAIVLRFRLIEKELKSARDLLGALRLVQQAEVDDWERSEVLREIVRVMLDRDDLASILDLLKNVHLEWVRARLFLAISEWGSDSQISSLATEVTESFTEDGSRCTVLAALVRRFSGVKQEQALSSFLERAGAVRRFELLRATSDIIPGIHRLEGRSGLMEVRRAIGDAGRWFP